MSDPCEDICDALVEFLVGLNDDPTKPLDPFQVEVSKPEDPNGALDEDLDKIRVLLWPHGESETKIGRGGQVLEVLQVAMLVITRIGTGARADYTREDYSTLTRTIKKKIRTGGKMAGKTYSTSETTKFDLDDLHGAIYSSPTILSYIGTDG